MLGVFSFEKKRKATQGEHAYSAHKGPRWDQDVTKDHSPTVPSIQHSVGLYAAAQKDTSQSLVSTVLSKESLGQVKLKILFCLQDREASEIYTLAWLHNLALGDQIKKCVQSEMAHGGTLST